jgi:hypothetical protein
VRTTCPVVRCGHNSAKDQALWSPGVNVGKPTHCAGARDGDATPGQRYKTGRKGPISQNSVEETAQNSSEDHEWQRDAPYIEVARCPIAAREQPYRVEPMTPWGAPGIYGVSAGRAFAASSARTGRRAASKVSTKNTASAPSSLTVRSKTLLAGPANRRLQNG